MTADASRPEGSPTGARGSWLAGPGFDLLFVANLWWVVAWLPGYLGVVGESPIAFWQIYFITTPHRWLTLVVVVSDPDRRGGRTSTFVWLAIIAAACVIGVHRWTGAFLCLLLVDYIWNAWHFAAQHAGVLRIYGRKTGGGRPRLEKHTMRAFVTYAILRGAGWSTGWTETLPWGTDLLRGVDVLMLGVAGLLLASELKDGLFRRPAKLIYVTSVLTLYAALVLAATFEIRSVRLSLPLAASAFHAVEYMAIVTFYAWRRQEHGSAGPFRSMARNWVRLLAVYIVLLGILSVEMDQRYAEFWLGLNIWAAFLHYAFDGMIWKLRQPATARTMGVQVENAS